MGKEEKAPVGTMPTATRYELLIDSEAFWERLKSDLEAARHTIYLQTLSYEGDRVGKKISEIIKTSSAADKRIIIDNYTRYVLSDKYLYSPRNWFNLELKREAADTAAMIAGLLSDGTRVKFVNPVGLLMLRLPSRNHKKIIAIDDNVSYIGGINFSDHNFAWHDMMLRIDNPEIAAYLKEDFLASWRGEHFGGRRRFEDIELFSIDGVNNRTDFGAILDLIDGAENSIYVQSPYLCHPFIDYLRDAAGRGVPVTVVSPENNNKKAMKGYIQYEAARSNFDLRFYQNGMSHLKAMLIDEKYLLLGSSNFDYFSYRFEQETVAVVTNRKVIRSFIDQVLNRDHSRCRPYDINRNGLSHRLRYFQVRTVAGLAGLFNRR